MKLEYDDEKELYYSGSLIRDDIIEGMHISQLIRQAFNDSSIWAFDGNGVSVTHGSLFEDLFGWLKF